MHQLAVAGNDRVGFLLERKKDIYADAILSAGADVASLHDPARSAGDYHEPLGGDPPAKLDCGLVGRMLRRQTGRTEKGDFAPIPKRSKDFEGVTQLFQGCVEELDIATIRVVANEFVGRFLYLLDELIDAEPMPVLLWMWLIIVDVLKEIVSSWTSLPLHPCSLFS
jgi:hypothetical protein